MTEHSRQIDARFGTRKKNRGFTRTPNSAKLPAATRVAPRTTWCRGFTRIPQRDLVASKKQRLWARPRLVSGFSLVELIIVVAIFALLSGLVLVRHSQFGGSLLLGNLSYEIALSIREAQALGLGAQGFNNNFAGRFGVHFEPGSTSYTLFADIDANNIRDPEGDEDVEVYTLGQGHSIFSVCTTIGSNPENCENTTLDIVFVRPDPEAIVDGGTNANARIVVESRTGMRRQIVVSSTGQISVQPASSVPSSPVI